MPNFRMIAAGCAALYGLAMSISTASADTSMSCAAISEKEIAGLFDRWSASLETKDPDKVLANYAPDAVLLPTISNIPRTDPAGIRAYFVEFLYRKPHGHIDTRTIHVGCNTAYDVGTYTFDLTGADGTHSQVAARYSFIYELRGGTWLIVHHHSSAMPEK